MGRDLGQLSPQRLGLLGAIGRGLAMQSEHVGRDGLGHLTGQAWVDQAREGNFSGKQWIVQQAIDPGPGALDKAELGKLGQLARRRRRHHGDLRACRYAHDDVVFRQRCA